jgi:uncharacterized membrane protein YedE/YeeE
MVELLLISLLISFLISVTLVPFVAGGKGRSAFGWALLSLLFSPIVTLIALAALPPMRRESRAERRAVEERRSPDPPHKRDPMRAFGWLLVLVGLFVGLGYPILAMKWSTENAREWILRESKAAATGYDTKRLRQLMAAPPLHLMPPSTHVSPWPGVALGGGLFALGLIVLAVRRPEREEAPPDPFEVPEFKWRKPGEHS